MYNFAPFVSNMSLRDQSKFFYYSGLYENLEKFLYYENSTNFYYNKSLIVFLQIFINFF